MTHLEHDIQALVLRGLGHLPWARYRAFKVSDPAKAAATMRTWPVSGAWLAPKDQTVTVGFSDAGLAAMGVSAQARAGLSPAFREGMQARHRARRLGDAPGSWGEGVNVWAAHFVNDAQLPDLATGGLAEIMRIHSVDLGGREHFGFRDGISQPRIGDAAGEVSLGEFVLGHRDGSGGPSADPSDGLLHNGSYAVVRQLEQDVEGFWRMVCSAQTDGVAAVDLASRIVGRTPEGRAVGPVGKAGDLDFRSDPHGAGCPVGAHVRRSNPRDSGEGNPALLQTATDRHRLLRRSRPYGPPTDASAYPEGIGTFPTAPGPGPRGLMFISFQADFERQFEFVQQAWIRNPHSGGSAGRPDPLLGDGGEFVWPRAEGTMRVPLGEPKVVFRGGLYLFVPGLTALARILGRRV